MSRLLKTEKDGGELEGGTACFIVVHCTVLNYTNFVVIPIDREQSAHSFQTCIDGINLLPVMGVDTMR